MITELLRRQIVHLLIGLLAFAGICQSATLHSAELSLRLRSRQETSPGSGKFHILFEDQKWNPTSAAIIVCDMWDLHHCLNATKRGAEMAPRMNEVLKKLRSQGVTVIHAPSGCMEFYKDHPARLRAQQVPRASQFPAEIADWCKQIPEEEKGTYPIDQSDGGEDDDLDAHSAWAEKLAGMGRNPKAPWIRQTDLLEVDDAHDYISDSGEEIWSILEQRGINNVVLLGVHVNMCVLGRPFGLRNMARYGKNVVLMRDMTDTMYNPKMSPYVSHFTGTDLIVEHIEKWVCPSITSDQVLGGKTFRYSTDKRPRVLIVCSEPEYKTDQTLPPFALHDLGKEFQTTMLFGDQEGNHIPALPDMIDDADVLLVSVRRRALPNDELEAIRRHVAAGKAVVGIRTASHAFSLRGAAPPEGHTTWESWDQDVFGGNYHNHHPEGPKTQIQLAPGADQHSIVRGLDLSNLVGNGSLYQVSPLADKATPLLIGSIPDQPAEPIAWTSATSGGGLAFYTSLGHIDDFQEPAFRQLLRNAVAWASGIEQ